MIPIDEDKINKNINNLIDIEVNTIDKIYLGIINPTNQSIFYHSLIHCLENPNLFTSEQRSNIDDNLKVLNNE